MERVTMSNRYIRIVYAEPAPVLPREYVETVL
jgi:hypothetical protein